MKEIWKDIEGYEGFYQVSNFGRVKRVEGDVKIGGNSNHEYQHLKERFLSLPKHGQYYQITLCRNGKTKRMLIHRLVAEAFIPNPDNLPCVNHKDENKKNNKVDNLEWCSYKYNNEYNNRVEKCKAKISKTLRGRPLSYIRTEEQKKKISKSVKSSWIRRKQKRQEEQ